MEDVITKLPPQNDEAERAVLGSMLLDSNAISTALEMLKETSFYSPRHGFIFSSILNLYDQGKPVDLLLLVEELNRQNQLEKVGGQGYVTSLLNAVASAAHIEHYAKIVKEKAVLRALINTSTNIISDCYKSEENPDEILDKAEQSIFDISQTRVSTGFSQISDSTHETIERINSFMTNSQAVSGISTGYADIDKMTSGFHPGNLIIVAGRPSMGKTAFCLNVMESVGVDQGLPVAMFSLEMSKDELVFRMVCSKAHVNLHHARTGFLAKNKFLPITNAATKLSESPIYIDDSASLSVLEMKSRARRLGLEVERRHGKKLSLIIVDYLQLMTGRSGKAEHRQQDISDITRGLKILAKDLNVPVIALSQLSRAPEKRNDARPVLSDLRESGAIEQDADLVAFIYREGYYKPDNPELENTAEVIIGKQRNGPTGRVGLIFNKEFARFENMSNVV